MKKKLAIRRDLLKQLSSQSLTKVVGGKSHLVSVCLKTY